MITLRTESNGQYMAFENTPANLKVVVNEYNRLQAHEVNDAYIVINGMVLENFEFEEFFDGRLSSLEFYAGLIESVEDCTLLEIRVDREAIIAKSDQDRNIGWDDGFNGLQMQETEKDNYFYGEGYSDGRACAYACD